MESASLTTVEKDQSKQFPERDEDLLRSLKLLAAGDSANFMVRDAIKKTTPERCTYLSMCGCFIL